MIHIGSDLSGQIKSICDSDNIFVITDSNVNKLYSRLFSNANTFIIQAGESSKSLDSLAEIVHKLIECNADRKTKIVAIGGGVVGDLAGFCAAVYMRGLDWISVPTTLLSQIDSGTGGKTAVNLEGYKNIIGSFHEPCEAIISHHFLDTLPQREKNCGLGEMVKTIFLSKKLKSFADENMNKLLAFDKEAIAEAVKICIEFKSEIVAADPKETTGLRKILNLGHTIGHALEKEDNFKLSHGEYVLWGLWYETYLTKKFVSMDQNLYMVNVLRKVLKGKSLDFDSMMVSRTAMSDKKNISGRISIIAATDMETRKELLFSQKEVYEGLEECKKILRP